MMKKYFGTDGMRFIFDKNSEELIKRLALSLSVIQSEKLFIGRDSRNSGKTIENILNNYINKKEMIFVGEISTPAICYLSYKYHCLGIMITASHNPNIYNGIKIFNNGEKISDDIIHQIEKMMDEVKETSANRDIITYQDKYKQEYLNFLSNHINKSKHKFLFDASNGSLSSYLEIISNKINNQNLVTNNHPNGENINDNCGSTNPQTLLREMKSNNFDFGFAFDGDGDRVIFAYKDKVYDGDAIIYMFSKTINCKNGIALTTLSNIGLINALEKNNIPVFISDVGDSNVIQNIIKHDLKIGGESSGHIIIKELLPTGDGLLNAINLINILENNSLDDLLKDFEYYPSYQVSFKINNPFTISHPIIKKLIKNYYDSYDNIKIVLRKSGTENLIRLYVSSNSKQTIELISNKIISYIKIIDNHILVDDFDANIIDYQSFFEGQVCLKGHNQIISSIIKNQTIIENSTIKNSIINESCHIGPYSHIRNNTIIQNNVKIGDFVELKNCHIDEGSKISHLTYLGDCIVGKNCNIGCGVISVNYDGQKKHQTKIGNNAFVGCNVNLIAPIVIEDNTYIAAGSTITKSLSKGSFAIARNYEVIKNNYAKKYPYFNKKEDDQ